MERFDHEKRPCTGKEWGLKGANPLLDRRILFKRGDRVRTKVQEVDRLEWDTVDCMVRWADTMPSEVEGQVLGSEC